MFKFLLFIIIALFIKPLGGLSQTKANSVVPQSVNLPLPATVINGDTVSICDLNTVNVVRDRVFANTDEAFKYYLLRRDVKVAYPYAVMAEITFKQCEQTMATMSSESEKKKYLKEMQTKMMAQYKEELKSLTVNQGKILIKLINRQTGTTSYEMVKELRGTLTAFMWQTVAGLFGNNMKATYDADNEDKEIENIVQLIETGAI